MCQLSEVVYTCQKNSQHACIILHFMLKILAEPISTQGSRPGGFAALGQSRAQIHHLHAAQSKGSSTVRQALRIQMGCYQNLGDWSCRHFQPLAVVAKSDCNTEAWNTVERVQWRSEDPQCAMLPPAGAWHNKINAIRRPHALRASGHQGQWECYGKLSSQKRSEWAEGTVALSELWPCHILDTVLQYTTGLEVLICC